jgi:hypothetical protein
MGKRGPKAVNLGPLMTWEFEFYKAFRMLRDGTPLPPKYGPYTGLTKQEMRKFLSQLKDMNLESYWLTSRRLMVELGHAENLDTPPSRMDLAWAKEERDGEIAWLGQNLRRPSRVTKGRQEIWNELVKASTYEAVNKACERWARLPDVQMDSMTPFPNHIRDNAAKFLAMKRNRRFPRSNYGDDARIDYLSRGMAGILSGVSPMTGIERLRNMEHQKGGPFWVTRWGLNELPEKEQHCGCWRCSMERSTRVSMTTQSWYENGLKLFMELAPSTKVPKDWIALRVARFRSNP